MYVKANKRKDKNLTAAAATTAEAPAAGFQTVKEGGREKRRGRWRAASGDTPSEGIRCN